MIKATRKQVRVWMLGVLAKQGTARSVDETERVIALALPTLQVRFPAEAFCQTSMDAAVAANLTWNEAGIIRALEGWRAENAAKGFRLPDEVTSAPVSPQARQWLVGWYKPLDEAGAERELALIRDKCPEAYAYLVRIDTRAAEIATWRRWHVPLSEADLAVDWDDEAAIRAKARAVAANPWMRGPLLKWLATCVRLHAPQHGPALFDELNAIAHPEPIEPPPPALPAPSGGGLYGD
jgi:hypothetical protein